MNKQSKMNKKAWSYKSYEFWRDHIGSPEEVAKDMLKRPKHYVRRHIEFLGEVKEKKVANILGSCGKKAIPLSILGADVTIVDISEQNKKYALELAEAAGINIKYIVSDFLELNTDEIERSFDIAYLEGGILHYFSDLNIFSKKIYDLLKKGGKLVLNDFHPFRKLLKPRDIFQSGKDGLKLDGDYFEDNLFEGGVAHEKFFPENEQSSFPKCLLRYWTLGEIITSFASSGFIIKKLYEGPRFDSHKNIPGVFTVVAYKN
ncbi:class I SAM-dependent methyltransferase [Natronospora cellulosivora (SeqCode)]